MFYVRKVTILTSCAKSSVSAWSSSKGEAVQEKEKEEWAFHGALRNTTAHWKGSREFSTDTYSWEPSSLVCLNPTHDNITKTEGLNLGQKKFVADGVKGLGKIMVDNIN